MYLLGRGFRQESFNSISKKDLTEIHVSLAVLAAAGVGRRGPATRAVSAPDEVDDDDSAGWAVCAPRGLPASFPAEGRVGCLGRAAGRPRIILAETLRGGAIHPKGLNWGKSQQSTTGF